MEAERHARRARRRRARGPEPRYAIGTVDKTRSSVPLDQAAPPAGPARDEVRRTPPAPPSTPPHPPRDGLPLLPQRIPAPRHAPCR